MFGTYRTLLAILVVFLHLGEVPVIGSYAVFGFYILSGYLMTLIMQKNYGYTVIGISKYALNRFLRIYPIYWSACIFTLILIYLLGDRFVAEYHEAMQVPGDLKSIIKNFLLIFPSLGGERLTPPAWALTVELFYYVCIGFGLSRARTLTVIWFIVSIVYTVIVNVKGMPWEYKYFMIPAASLPFSTGAMIYHFQDDLKAPVKKLLHAPFTPYILFFAILANWKIGLELDTLRGFSFYSNFIICAVMIVCLSQRKELPFISKRFDKLMGDFSYPIYLIHYQVGLLVLVVMNSIGYEVTRPDMVLTYVSLPVIIAFAWLISKYMERPVEMVRSRVKGV